VQSLAEILCLNKTIKTPKPMINILAGLLGVVFITVAHMVAVQKTAKKANDAMAIVEYLKSDALSIVLSIISVAVWQLLFGEITAKYPQLEGFTRTSFFAMGAVGSYAIIKALGKAKSSIDGIVDTKTDQLDELKTKEDAK
jgi:hypothetical protein